MVPTTQPSSPEIFIREVNRQDIQLAYAIKQVVNDAYQTGWDGWTSESKIIKVHPILLLAFLPTDAGDEVVGTVQVLHKEGDDEAEIKLFSVKALRMIKEDLKYKHAFVHVLENRIDILGWYCKLEFKETGERIAFAWHEHLLMRNILTF
ncbi:hypothetical protein BGW37DRAFT_496347 [Umbelopsis sp. PMI_123]|nr:hypothetical protein BGW37DRAFT_496347 [Umbelopsis sp. PMI_123]